MEVMEVTEMTEMTEMREAGEIQRPGVIWVVLYPALFGFQLAAVRFGRSRPALKRAVCMVKTTLVRRGCGRPLKAVIGP